MPDSELEQRVASAAVPAPGRGRRRVVAALIVLGGVFVIAAVWYLRRPPAPPGPPVVDLTGADPELTQAVEQAREAVRKSPRSARVWGRLGMVLGANGFRDEAVQAFAEAERLDPRDPRWPYLQGLTFQRGDPNAAIPKLRRAVELSHEPAPRLRLAEVLLDQGRIDEAEALYRDVEHADRGNPRAALGLARVARARGDVAACLGHLQQAEEGERAPRKAARFLRAEVLGQTPGKEAEAEREQEAAARLPDDPPAPDPYHDEGEGLRVGKQTRIERVNALRRSNRVVDAIELGTQTVRLYPDSDMAWLALGQALFQARDYPGAERAFGEAARCDPKRFEARFRLGVALYLQRGRRPHAVADAAAAFRQAIGLAPTVSSAHFRLGLCLEDEGDWDGAVAAYRAAVRCRPEYAEAHRRLGQLLAGAAARAATLAGMQRLLGCPAVVDAEGLVWAQALGHLRKAAQLAPDDTQTRQALERIAGPARE